MRVKALSLVSSVAVAKKKVQCSTASAHGVGEVVSREVGVAYVKAMTEVVSDIFSRYGRRCDICSSVCCVVTIFKPYALPHALMCGHRPFQSQRCCRKC